MAGVLTAAWTVVRPRPPPQPTPSPWCCCAHANRPVLLGRTLIPSLLDRHEALTTCNTLLAWSGVPIRWCCATRHPRETSDPPKFKPCTESKYNRDFICRGRWRCGVYYGHHAGWQEVHCPDRYGKVRAQDACMVGTSIDRALWRTHSSDLWVVGDVPGAQNTGKSTKVTYAVGEAEGM